MFDLQGFGPQIAFGAWMTVQVALGGLLVGLICGLLGAWAKLSPYAFFRALGQSYTTVVRGIPEILVVLLVYFGGEDIINRMAEAVGYDDYIEINVFVAGVCALGLSFGAYATEVFRGAIQSVPRGQIEAGIACGMQGRQVFWRITLPQAMRLAIPGLGNLFQVLLKDTSLVSLIALPELMRNSAIAISNTKEPFTFYFIAALIYLAITSVVMLGQIYAEKWANRGVKRAAS
ncbi:histidine/lysine/arginine/ornithine transporter subunit; membrane component of ABC superfamily [Candidatus Terasakiella magnetica]|uniref:Histidine/lysine/arginine/ornithine transporter subunit membrane component of ABC superfamily n=1 Tax=Candidatus Terasakiella magnetica TaxID=1867952 RepID=A0A1C3RKU9_9PROT|nr:ABC transporter permease [Candidatus Terasakiella magnetica]SCA57799.1 histidine/lysine/arginine/ornithine transporter subunit; membrane component of ABC superfamily [Candidatus Terasakiella magnetica]